VPVPSGLHFVLALNWQNGEDLNQLKGSQP